MVPVFKFSEVIAQSNKSRPCSLLLGNGFGIALNKAIFDYKALYEKADFSAIPEAKEVFKKLKTCDFEKAIRQLGASANLSSCFTGGEPIAQRMGDCAKQLQTKLIDALSSLHPPNSILVDDEKKHSCSLFLQHFLGAESQGKVFTLNYDLLLYWAVCYGYEVNLFIIADGFLDGTWTANYNANIYYLHGALHLFGDDNDIGKKKYATGNVPLMGQIKTELERGRYPLFVSEGTSKDKLQRIRQNAYFSHAYSKLKELEGTLFFYGVSLAENDAHIWDAVVNSNVTHLYISLYGEPENNQEIITKGVLMQLNRGKGKPLDITYYDSKSALVWDNPRASPFWGTDEDDTNCEKSDG